MDRLIYFFACVALLLAAPASAADKDGFAFHIGVGGSSIRDEDDTDTFSGSDFAYSLGFEYRFKGRFGLGINIVDFGQPDDELNGVPTEIDVEAIDLLARFYFPISDTSEFYVLLGAASYFADLNPGGSNGFGDDAFEIGGGFDIDTSEHFSLRFEGRYFNGVRDESGATLTAGFVYWF